MEKMEKMGRRFEGKVAVVTASTDGIGYRYSIAERLGLEGASLVVSSRNSKNVEEAVEKLKGNGIQASGVVCHVANALQRENLIQHTIQKHGKIDVFVLNAAVNPTPGPILDTPESALDKMWEVNVKASVLLLQEATPHLTTGSSITFISSIAAYQPVPLLGMYGATKSALHALTQSLASEMGPNTRVNCVAPGYVPTKFSSIALKNEQVINGIIGRTFLKRPGTAQEIATAVVFLASNDASYITGETLVVAAGLQSRL